MPQNPKKRPDTPLANTPVPVKIDNTYVKKPKVGIIAPQPKYKYVEAEVNTIRGGKPFSKKDSLDYKKSFQNKMGVKGLSNEVFFNGYSSGELEATDLKKSKKKIIKK